MNKFCVELENVYKSFQTLKGNVPVLQHCSFCIENGEFFILLGPSGSGKSTLLNLIAGLEKPTKGTIRIKDKVVADSVQGIYCQPFNRNIAMVFQSYALYPHMNVQKNIAYPLTNLKPRISKSDIQKKVIDIARMLSIEDLLDRRPAELSGGQRQRVAIGRALIRNPSVFLLDEPLSNLDAQLRFTMRTQIKSLQQKLGITTIYVTHDQAEALSLADRIAILNHGKIVQIASSADIYHKPINSFVAGFIGSPPMNLIMGKIIRKENHIEFKSQKFTFMLRPFHFVSSCNQIEEHKPYILGIRPEHINLVGTVADSVLSITLDVVEMIGSDYFASLYLDTTKLFTVRLNTRPDSMNVNLSFRPQSAHLFSN